MQKVQAMSQPGAIDTHARNPGSSPRGGQRAWGTSRCTRAHPSGDRRARPAPTGRAGGATRGSRRPRRPRVLSAGSRRSFCARHPLTTITCGLAALDRLEVSQVAVQLVVGVLPDHARIEHDHRGLRHVLGLGHAPGRQETGDPARSRVRSSGTRTCGSDSAVPPFEGIGSRARRQRYVMPCCPETLDHIRRAPQDAARGADAPVGRPAVGPVRGTTE